MLNQPLGSAGAWIFRASGADVPLLAAGPSPPLPLPPPPVGPPLEVPTLCSAVQARPRQTKTDAVQSWQARAKLRMESLRGVISPIYQTDAGEGCAPGALHHVRKACSRDSPTRRPNIGRCA